MKSTETNFVHMLVVVFVFSVNFNYSVYFVEK